jgi:uncharacterized alkaline shock family protein YloU
MSDGHVLRQDGGSITVTPGALAQIVQGAAETVEGARVRRPRRGLEVRVDDGRIRVEVELGAQYGIVLPDLARDVQGRIADALATMVELEVQSVDVSIEELEGV